MAPRRTLEHTRPKSRGKIAYITSTFPLLRETFISREIIELERRDFEILVISLKNAPQQVGEQELPKGETVYTPFLFSLSLLLKSAKVIARRPVRVIRALAAILLGHFRSPVRIIKFLAVLPKCLYLVDRFQEENVLHIHAQFATVPTTCAYFISRVSGLRFSFTAHAWDIYVKGNEIFLKEKLQAADRVITVSKFNRAYLVSIGGDDQKVNVVYQGLELERYRYSARMAGEIPLVAGGGALVPKKGLHVLIHALAEVKSRGIPFRARIFGEGREQARLLALAKSLGLESSVEFVGTLLHRRVIDLMQQADVFVLASVRAKDGSVEGLPNVVAEAMACGAAVVASRLTGIPELVRDGIDGLLFPPGDFRALADALSKLLQDSALRARLAGQARGRVEAFFDLRRNIEPLATYFQGVLSGSETEAPPLGPGTIL